MPKPYATQLRDDVVAVAQCHELGAPIKQIVQHFGISDACLQNARVMRTRNPAYALSYVFGLGRAALAAQMRSTAGAGKRSSTPRYDLTVPGLPAVNRLSQLGGELAADGMSFAVTYPVLKLARQLYYQSLANPFTNAELVDTHWANDLIHSLWYIPGHRLQLLADEAAQVTAARRVSHVCEVNCWFGRFSKKLRRGNGNIAVPWSVKTSSSGTPAHKRRTSCGWPTSENSTGKGKFYLCVIGETTLNLVFGYPK